MISRIVTIAFVAISAACARTNTNVSKSQRGDDHQASRAVERVRGATNTNANGSDPIIDNDDVERTRQRTNTNASGADPK